MGHADMMCYTLIKLFTACVCYLLLFVIFLSHDIRFVKLLLLSSILLHNYLATITPVLLILLQLQPTTTTTTYATLNTWPCLGTPHHSTSSQLLQLTNCPCCYILSVLHWVLFVIKLAKSLLYVSSSAVWLLTWACRVMREDHVKL